MESLKLPSLAWERCKNFQNLDATQDSLRHLAGIPPQRAAAGQGHSSSRKLQRAPLEVEAERLKETEVELSLSYSETAMEKLLEGPPKHPYMGFHKRTSTLDTCQC